MRLYQFVGITAMIAVAMVSFSCSHENDTEVTKKVTFCLQGLDVTTEAMAPRREGDISPQQANMTDIWVWEGQTLLAHQVSTDADFGSPSIDLAYGSHSLTFVASNQSGQSWSDGVWHADKANDCFGAVHALSVGGNTETQAVVLGRAAYGLKWQSTDLVPTGVRTLRLKVSPMSESLADGLTATNGYEREWTYDVSSRVGTVISVTVYGLPEQYGEECNISTTIEWLGSTGNVLYSHTKVAPVKSNRMTIISGALFSGHSDASIRMNTEWEEAYETSVD